ncbi:MAG: DUF5106 domain-containing protein [Bacteroidia bacterium]|nr:DUF5106 domain-containing protein [Bacteroidia bacterium]
MKKIIVSCLIWLMAMGISSAKDEGYNISITIKGYPNKKFFLGYYFGDKQYLRDSTTSDKTGKMVFKGDKPLEGGVYLLASAEKNLIFDFVISEPVFTLETDTADLVNNMKIKGSPENDVFFTYTKYTTKMGKEAMKLDEGIKTAKDKNDTAQTRILTDNYRVITTDLVNYRKNIMTQYPSTLISKIFKMMVDVDVPPAPLNNMGEIIDSNFQYHYYYNHYFDNFDWSDNRIVRTPVFHQKLEYFMLKLTPQIPDSIISSANYILKKSEAGKENFKYCLFWITNHYETSNFMGMDKVFVHMVDQYYTKGKAFWVDETLLFKMKDRADQLRNNLLGSKGPNLNMMDTSNVYHTLYNLKADYTLLIFWDANCGKCKEEMPKLKVLYNEMNPKGAKTKYFDVFGVSLTPDAKEWQKYLRENKLPWLNVYDPNNETNFRRLYDIYSTPVLYLLDVNKKIIAKRLNVDQLREFIKEYEKIHAQ